MLEPLARRFSADLARLHARIAATPPAPSPAAPAAAPGKKPKLRFKAPLAKKS